MIEIIMICGAVVVFIIMCMGGNGYSSLLSSRLSGDA